eukprot:c4273_g1_i1.p1 GENE.c4273_g1_i1~~c4273_g1_i1.p1  ORF type:complete len:216 (+),score=64.31 c4273_g1_i1:146-793(+)
MSKSQETTTARNEIPVTRIGSGQQQPEAPCELRVVAGAAAAGLLAGYAFSGVTIGVVLGGAAALATQRPDQVGGAARTTGTAVAGAYDRAVELDNKYHIRERAVQNAKIAAEKAKEMTVKAQVLNEEYKISERAKQGAIAAAEKTKQLNEHYQITARLSARMSEAIQSWSPRPTTTCTPTATASPLSSPSSCAATTNTHQHNSHTTTNHIHTPSK